MSETIKCPSCGATDIRTEPLHVNIKKALEGNLALTHAKIVNGRYDSSWIDLVCNSCGHFWKDPDLFKELDFGSFIEAYSPLLHKYKVEKMMLYPDVISEPGDYHDFFEFAHSNASGYGKVFALNSTLFYFENTGEIDAYSITFEEYNLIVITKVFWENLRDRVFESKNAFCVFPDAIEINKTGAFFMEPIASAFVFSTSFVFFHELGHILRKNGTKSESHEKKEEKDLKPEEIILSHVDELDADESSGLMVSHQILSFWREFSEENQTKSKLETLVAMALIGYFILFSLLSGDHDIYFTARRHPHPIVRIWYVSEVIFDHLDTVLKLKLDRLEIKANICKVISAFGLKTLVDQYMQLDADRVPYDEYIKIIRDEQERADDRAATKLRGYLMGAK